jgi:hypothetical protein
LGGKPAPSAGDPTGQFTMLGDPFVQERAQRGGGQYPLRQVSLERQVAAGPDLRSSAAANARRNSMLPGSGVKSKVPSTPPLSPNTVTTSPVGSREGRV